MHPMKPMTPLRHALGALAVLVTISLASCVQAPPPRTYNPKVARHLHQLSHDTPVTPIPYGGWGYYGSYYYGY